VLSSVIWPLGVTTSIGLPPQRTRRHSYPSRVIRTKSQGVILPSGLSFLPARNDGEGSRTSRTAVRERRTRSKGERCKHPPSRNDQTSEPRLGFHRARSRRNPSTYPGTHWKIWRPGRPGAIQPSLSPGCHIMRVVVYLCTRRQATHHSFRLRIGSPERSHVPKSEMRGRRQTLPGKKALCGDSWQASKPSALPNCNRVNLRGCMQLS